MCTRVCMMECACVRWRGGNTAWVGVFHLFKVNSDVDKPGEEHSSPVDSVSQTGAGLGLRFS